MAAQLTPDSLGKGPSSRPSANPLSKRILAEVSITLSSQPASSRHSVGTSSTESPLSNASTVSLSGSEIVLSDDETPATSELPTPATSVVSKRPLARKTSLRHSAVKRKLDTTVNIYSPSAKSGLEAAASKAAISRGSKRSRTNDGPSRVVVMSDTEVSDSDTELSDLTPYQSEDSWCGDLAQDRPGRRKASTSSGKRVNVVRTNQPKASMKTRRSAIVPAETVDHIVDTDSHPDSLVDSTESDILSYLSAEYDDEDEASVPRPPILDPQEEVSGTFGDEVNYAVPTPRQRVESRRDSYLKRRKMREMAQLEFSHPIIKTMWDDLANTPIIPPEQAPQPASITRSLKSFQLEGLNWMMKQEQSHFKGGLLGDEMGMGKTIQAVSLIMSDFPAKDPTIVVVPPVALIQWTNEIKEYTDGKLQVIVYHGQKSKKLRMEDLTKYNVIMISYQSLESLYRKETKGWNRGENTVKEDSPIHALHFHRIILDEAHSIKQRATGVAKACFALKGTHKWCLSGTPVQNRIGEFFSLLRFLEVRPYADYFCRKCDCAQLHWSLDSVTHRCSYCKHSGVEHVSLFNQQILNPITQTGSDTLRQEALDKLRLITDRIMLRRLKRDYTNSMDLPPKEVILRNEFFGEIERDFSSSIMKNTNRQFDTYVSRGVMLNNYANIFGLIMQMRQVADHPDLLLRKKSEGGQNVLVCNICDEAAEEAVRSRCKHEFCRSCIKEYVESCDESQGSADCPRCHIPLSIDFDQPEIEQDEEFVKKNSIINRIRMEKWTSSTKIEMLVYDLYKLRSRKQTTKSIVFSQFTSMLQLIEWRLRRAGFNTVMLDGSMTPVQRQRSIDFFMGNADVEVFLVSLKAGGVALNLTEASRVFIVDPWWNPAAEWQSADRCHRIGQKRPCVITRLCIEDSVESRIVMLQEKKANMINGTINNDKMSMDKLTPADLQFLFRGS